MKRCLLAVALAMTVTTPAAPRNGSIYLGVEGGLMKPKDLAGGADVKINQTFNPPGFDPITRFDPLGFLYERTFDEGFDPRLKRGHDIAAVLGHDFGFIRLEGEVGHKKAKREGFDAADGVRNYLDTALNRPRERPGSLPRVTNSDFAQFDGKISLKTMMINALVDLGDENGLSFYAGGGGGRVWAAALNDRDKAFAYQLIAGARYAVSRHMDIGLKYRHFRAGEMSFQGGPFGVAGNDRIIAGRRFVPSFSIVDLTLSRTAEVTPEFGGKYNSHSLLASLTYNFGRAETLSAPPPLLPSPPPVSTSATQICSDGRMIPAVESCPLPPPPLPSPAPERG